MLKFEAILLVIRMLFWFMGISSVVAGTITIMVLPVLFVIALFAILAGVLLIVSGFRAHLYVDRERFEAAL